MSWPRLQQRLSLRCSGEGARVVARVKARLQLSDPIPARGEYQVRIGLQVLLELALIELRIVEGGEARGQASESPDEPETSGFSRTATDEGEFPISEFRLKSFLRRAAISS